MTLASVIRFGAVALLATTVDAGQHGARAFETGTKSKQAAALVRELQQRIENLQFGPRNQELATEAVAADPEYALAHYYVAAGVFPPDLKALARAVELAKKAPEGERRFIEIQATTFTDPTIKPNIEAIGPLSKLAEAYPGERMLQVVIGQYQALAGHNREARKAYERALALDATTPRVHSLLAGLLILEGEYAAARRALQAALARVPPDAAPGNIRYQVAFTYLYEGDMDAALATLTAFVDEYRAKSAPAGLPEVFIWNSIARINLENGRLEAAMQAYERGYASVPGSGLDETQKKIWYGRLLHGKSRTLARMGRQEEAWQYVDQIRKMIDEGGEDGKQFEPAYHYVAGYCKLEAGDAHAAIEHLKLANPDDPFHRLLLARAYEKAGEKAEARRAYQQVVASTTNNLERALAYPEAKRKLGAS